MKRINLALFAALLLCAPVATAARIDIGMADADLTYSDPDGSGAGTGTLSSLGSIDSLQALAFEEDDLPLGVLASPPHALSFELNVLGVPNIAMPPLNDSTFVTAPQGGTFKLTINANTALELSLETVEIIYTRISAGSFQANFLFTGTVGSITGQALPFGIVLAEPVSLSFNVQQDSYSELGGYLKSFAGGGVGAISAQTIPEPSSMLIAGLGSLLAVAAVRARAKK